MRDYRKMIRESAERNRQALNRRRLKEDYMSEWRSICRAFAKKVGAELCFVKEDSFGIQYPDGSVQHIYADELVSYLRDKNYGKRLKEDYTDDYAYAHAHLLSEHRVDMSYKLMNYLLDLTSYGEYTYDRFWGAFMRELYPKLHDCIDGFDKPEFDDEGVTFYNVIAEEVPTIDWACDVWFRQMYNKLKERFD